MDAQIVQCRAHLHAGNYAAISVTLYNSNTVLLRMPAWQYDAMGDDAARSLLEKIADAINEKNTGIVRKP